MGKVRLSDGRIAEAHDVYAGKARQITVEGLTTFWSREAMQPLEEEELVMSKVPAIDRLIDLKRYEGALIESGDSMAGYYLLVKELQTEARQELREKWGV